MSNLPFTGERFTPECVREMWYEHYHRYAFARALVAGKSVADIACGEGYGAALLAQSASSAQPAALRGSWAVFWRAKRR